MKTGCETASGTREWAASNVNCLIGCSHNCRYCYAKAMAIRFKRMTAAEWEKEKPVGNRKGYRKRKGRIMFPSSHDITPQHADLCLERLIAMLKAGNNVLVVSKPHYDVIQKLCEALLPYRDQIIFRFTIGSADDDILGFWEPGAPGYGERIQSLQHAHEKGYTTSVSCEPMLDGNIDKVIDDVRPFVSDSIWLGIMKSAMSRIRINGEGEDAIRKTHELMRIQKSSIIVALYNRYKRDPLIKWKDSIREIIARELNAKIIG